MWDVLQMQFKRQLDAARADGPNGPFVLEAFFAMALWALTTLARQPQLPGITVAVRTDVTLPVPAAPAFLLRLTQRYWVTPAAYTDSPEPDAAALAVLVDAVMPYPLLGQGEFELPRTLPLVQAFCALSEDAPEAEVRALVVPVAMRLQQAFVPLELRYDFVAESPPDS